MHKDIDHNKEKMKSKSRTLLKLTNLLSKMPSLLKVGSNHMTQLGKRKATSYLLNKLKRQRLDDIFLPNSSQFHQSVLLNATRLSIANTLCQNKKHQDLRRKQKQQEEFNLIMWLLENTEELWETIHPAQKDLQ